MRDKRMLSQLLSARTTCTFFCSSTLASSLANWEAPNISSPWADPAFTPRNLAQAPAVRLWVTTVPMMIRNTRGTILSAPATPRRSSLIANRDDTAAATIPLGATQLKNHLSALGSEVPKAQHQTLRGLAINITTSKSAKPCQPNCIRAAESNLAANKMKRPEIKSTVSVSLNSTISPISTPRMFASQIPITVTVSRPDSSCSRFDATKAPNMMVSTAVFFR